MHLLPWPVPALLGWGAAWLAYGGTRTALAPLAAMLLGSGMGVALSVLAQGWWRRALVALGFPLSLALSGTEALPAWAWLVPLALLLVLYPVRTWRDAPLFPTPRGALAALAGAAPLPPGAALLDAGCGLGDGLKALRQAYPNAALHGIEWSWPLALLCRLRCRFAQVRQGDLWAADWGGYHLVYLFQRPESMARAAAKAQREMAPQSWLVSLAFEVPGLLPVAQLPAPEPQRTVWVYRVPDKPRVSTPNETT